MPPTVDFTSTAHRQRLVCHSRRGLVHRGSVLLIANLIALTGCSAGQDSQTARTVAAIPGVDANLGDIALRNAQILYGGREQRVYPVGGTAPLDVRLFNGGSEPDALLDVKAEGVGQVVLISSDGRPSQVCPEADVSVPPVTQPPVSPSEVPTPSQGVGAPAASPTEKPNEPTEPPSTPESADSAAGAPHSTPASSPDFTVALAPGDCALLNPDGSHHLALVDLQREISPGDSLEITFVFREAGELTLTTPVGSPSGPGDHSPVNMHPEEPPVVGAKDGGHGSEHDTAPGAGHDHSDDSGHTHGDPNHTHE